MSSTGTSAALAALQSAATNIQTAITALQPTTGLTGPTGTTGATGPTSANFKPINPTASDIYTSAAAVIVPADKVSRNIICTGSTPTQVQSTLEADWWVAKPDTSDGGKVWVENHATGQILTLYFCAPGIHSVPPVSSQPTPTPTPAPTTTGAPVLTGTVIAPALTPVTADSNFVVLTRSDGRIVYHLGILNPIPPADTNATLSKHLGPYSIGGFNIPAHWWLSRWTDRTKCPITIKKSPAQLVAAKRMFPYANIGVPYAPQPARVKYNPMYSSDITIWEETTGERPDIGLITDASAYYMLGGDPGRMIDWALCAETEPTHFRDQSTDQPIDLVKYPVANSYDAAGYQGSPWLCKGPPNSNQGNYSVFGGGWLPQQAHKPELSYIAQLATGDLGFLEDLQYAANFMVLCNASLSDSVGVATISGEDRGVGWALRDLFMAHIATQDAEAAGVATGPGTPFQPSSYFKTLLNNALAYYSKAITDTITSGRQVFHMVVANSRMAPWELDYILTALAFGILTGHSDWVPLYLWALNNAIDRLSSTSGYPPGWGCVYALDATQPSWATAFAALQTNNQGGTTPSAAQLATLAADQFNGGVSMDGYEYLMTTRAVMVHAQYLDNLGLAPVRAKFPNLDFCYGVVNKMIVGNGTGTVNPRQSVVVDPTLVSSTIVPYVA